MVIIQISCYNARISVTVLEYKKKKSTVYMLHLLQYDYSGYLWAVGHLVCVGKSLNI